MNLWQRLYTVYRHTIRSGSLRHIGYYVRKFLMKGGDFYEM